MAAIDQAAETAEASLIDRCEGAGVVFSFSPTISWACGWHYGPGAGHAYASGREAAEDAVRVLGPALGAELMKRD